MAMPDKRTNAKMQTKMRIVTDTVEMRMLLVRSTMTMIVGVMM